MRWLWLGLIACGGAPAHEPPANAPSPFVAASPPAAKPFTVALASFASTGDVDATPFADAFTRAFRAEAMRHGKVVACETDQYTCAKLPGIDAAVFGMVIHVSSGRTEVDARSVISATSAERQWHDQAVVDFAAAAKAAYATVVGP